MWASPPGRSVNWTAIVRLWAALTIASSMAVLSLGAYAGWNLRDLPRPGDQAAIVRSVDILDRGGQLIARRSSDGQFHIYAPLSQMGPYGPSATLAAEDRNFYHHAAVDAASLARAAATDLLRNEVVEGGSTITQQLVKLELLGPEQTLRRKLQEGFLAYAMERRYSKDEILEMYLNRVYYGHGAYGLAAAVQAYFGRDRTPADLTAAQAAFLAGLLQGPNRLDPQQDFGAARARQLYVLAGMRDMGVLSAAQEQAAEEEDVRAKLKFDTAVRVNPAPHFVDWILREAERDVGAAVLQRGGLRIHTTLDLNLQSLAERAVAGGVKDMGRMHVNNGALLAVKPATGEILAWVGSADFSSDAIGGQYDLVLARRQPGSSFKPYVYEAALRDRRITLCTTLQDRQTSFGGYVPHDYDDRYLGAMSARRALLLSRNVPAVQVGQVEGLDRVDALAKQMGIGTKLGTNPATAIGTSEVTMLDQVQAYSVFADQGRKVPLMGITAIDDVAGDSLFARQPGTQPGQTAVLTAAEAFLVTDVLKDYQRQWGLGWNRQMASKSGTTGSQTGVHPDAWMMAYSPDIVVGAWAGNTAADGGGAPTAAFGTDVGKTISARFLNGLPRTGAHWYSRPSGVVQGRGGELFLAGTQSTSCGAAAQPTSQDRSGDEKGADKKGGDKNGGGPGPD
jgi:membrane peptidoglycan carboxypeptidase